LNIGATCVWITGEDTMSCMTLMLSFSSGSIFNEMVTIIAELAGESIWMTCTEEILRISGTVKSSFNILVVLLSVVVNGTAIDLFSRLQALVPLIFKVKVPPRILMLIRKFELTTG